jgi:hypothetical protein
VIGSKPLYLQTPASSFLNARTLAKGVYCHFCCAAVIVRLLSTQAMDRPTTLLLSRLCSTIVHRTTVSYTFLVGLNRLDSLKLSSVKLTSISAGSYMISAPILVRPTYILFISPTNHALRFRTTPSLSERHGPSSLLMALPLPMSSTRHQW